MTYPAFETLTLSRSESGIVTVALNRPDRMNAMTSTMFDEFDLLARAVTADRSARVLILTGAGRAFCAGYDTDEAKQLSVMSGMDFLELQERAARALSGIRSVRVPVIAAVNGVAAGGGLALALAADIRLASPAARFNAAFVRIGLSAGDLGTSWLLPRLVGPAVAAEIAFTGRLVGASEAARIGLVNSVSADGELLADAEAMAELICTNSPSGVAMSKRALQANGEISSYAAAMELENRGQALLTRTEDMPEALAAFLDKRAPNFTGQ
ncbi:enoyl-CoA hydratase/isomerase family protein [Subtercola endophyticus]|uniref:enoyl-CoA hydratase/isomerase family protein n=1 Tax=Subtercola endophyticus TaxID=2895559 RepID=UPI001E49ABA5|nr:enoyl-CoA hydratase-related protein [Subtercola endophyticus]UFS58131.1 enoyl-CoA hydratase-related protein [Subtercola endophyticus]